MTGSLVEGGACRWVRHTSRYSVGAVCAHLSPTSGPVDCGPSVQTTVGVDRRTCVNNPKSNTPSCSSPPYCALCPRCGLWCLLRTGTLPHKLVELVPNIQSNSTCVIGYDCRDRFRRISRKRTRNAKSRAQKPIPGCSGRFPETRKGHAAGYEIRGPLCTYGRPLTFESFGSCATNARS
jgi:hypothetical protein